MCIYVYISIYTRGLPGQGDLDDIDMEFKQRVLEHLRIRAEEARNRAGRGAQREGTSINMCTYIHVCLNMYLCIYVYIYIYMYECVSIYIYIYMHVCEFARIRRNNLDPPTIGLLSIKDTHERTLNLWKQQPW